MNLRGNLVLCAAFALCAPALAQETAMTRVEARVTAASGGGVYLDVGSDAGVQPGDRARALPLGRAPVELVVRTVSRQSSRCELVSATTTLELGTTIDVFVPAARVSAAASAAEHPPWTHPTEAWTADTPLLAPAASHSVSQRESTLSGRWYTSFDATSEHVSDSQTYALARTGLELDYDNLFGTGDALYFDGELFARDANLADNQDDEETHARIDRLSWRLGGTRDNPQRFEVGRFLHSEMPALGILDGVEYVHRLDSGDRVGASVGFLPDWTPAMNTGEDAEVAVFYRHVVGANEEFSLGAALQKTWHQGASDRDLAVGDLSWRLTQKLSLYASAWIDYYGGDDAPKSSGLEVTQAQLNTTYRIASDASVGLSLAHIRWPVLLRDELPPVTLNTLADGQVDRASASASKNVTKNTRLYGRFDLWSSDSDSGDGGEVSYSVRDWLWKSGEVGVALFASDGEFSSLLGGRLSANKSAPSGFWTLAYELANHEQDNFNGAQAELLQQAVRASWDGEVGDSWDLSLGLDQRFGDEQGSISLGFWLQKRF